MKIYKRKLATPVATGRLLLFIPLFIGLFAYFLDIRLQIVAFDVEGIPPLNEMTVVALFITALLIILNSYYITFTNEGILKKGILTNRFIPSKEIISYKLVYPEGNQLCKIKIKNGKEVSFVISVKREQLEEILDSYIALS